MNTLLLCAGLALLVSSWVRWDRVGWKYVLTGGPGVMITLLMALMIRQAVVTHNEAWIVLSIFCTFFYLLGAGFFLTWVGQEERWWGRWY